MRGSLIPNDDDDDDANANANDDDDDDDDDGREKKMRLTATRRHPGLSSTIRKQGAERTPHAKVVPNAPTPPPRPVGVARTQSVERPSAPTEKLSYIRKVMGAAGDRVEVEEDARGAPEAFPLKGAVVDVGPQDCEIVHPGTECCTRTTVADDGESVTVSCSIRPNCSGKNLSAKDRVALAALAIERAGKRLFQRETRDLRKQRRVESSRDRHHELCFALHHGKILSAQQSDHESEFFHESYLVEVEDPKTKQRLKALFKPKSEDGEATGWHRIGGEVAAYHLNLLLGLDLVPPTVMRKGIVVGDRVHDEGCLTLFIDKAEQLNQVDPQVWGWQKDLILSDTRILDVLLHNSDRHHGHFLYGDHWIGETPAPFLIDHAASFRKEACVRMDHENAFLTGPTKRISARTYLHLRYLSHELLEAKLSHQLTGAEICELNGRKEAVLDYFDGLVFFNGYDAVVID